MLISKPLTIQPPSARRLRAQYTHGKSVVYVPSWGLTVGEINGYGARFEPVSTTAKTQAGLGGIGATSADTSGSVRTVANIPTFSNGAEKTILLYFKTGAVATSPVYVLAANLAIAARHSSASNQWGIYDGGTIKGSGEVLAANTHYCVAVCIDAAGNVRFYSNGKAQGTNTTTNYVGSGQMYVGSYSTGGLTEANTVVYLAAILDVDLAPVAKDITANPWMLFEPQRIFIPVSTAGASSYTLNMESGSYAITGSDATLLHGYLHNLEPGSYTLSGSSATLLKNSLLNLESGSYTISGSDVTFSLAKVMNLESGSYALTGADTTFVRSYQLNMEAGSYVLSGQDITFVYSGASNTVTIKAGSWLRYRTIQ